jgi:chondroitin sulfate synthase
MPRIAFNRWKHSLFLICFFFLGFFLGLHYWELVIPNHCLSTISSSPEKSIIIKSNLFYNHFQYRTIETCQNETSNIFLTIIVLSSYERLVVYLPAILETWVLTATNEIEIIIFLEEKSFGTEEYIEKIFFNLNKNIKSCLFIVKLKHVENEYPPQKKSFYAMKFLYTYYQYRTSWLLRLDDNAYVNIPELIKWLKSIDHNQPLYIGQGGTGRHNGPAIYFPPGKYFCMGGSGVILSQQTLSQLGPRLDQCFQFELRTNHEDVELGRCILTHVQIGCTTAYNSKVLFYHHYGPHYSFGYDFTPKIISQAFIIHPINNRTTFQQIFHFYHRKQQQKKLHLSNWKLKNQINYVTFLSSMEFDLVRDIHYQLIDARWKLYIETTVQSYIEHLQKLWHQHSSNWTIINGKLLLGYHRVIPRYGLELIIEILLNVRSSSISPSQSIIVRKRFHIRQPFVEKKHFDYREIINLDIQLNLIVISSNKNQALRRFIKNFQYEIINYPDRKNYFTLTILYFFEKNSIINYIHQLSVRYPLIIRLLIINETEHKYNRGLGRQLALKYFTNNQLLFFIDVDLTFTGQSLINTRHLLIHQLSISSCAVYFPIIYSSFSNIFRSNNHSMIDIKTNFGLFSIYGFGNVAVRKDDLERIGGWEINNHDWGYEDVNLFSKFVNYSSECSIFRAVEPGLKHYYHKKMCYGIENKTRQKMCYDAEANLLASQIDMINYIFDKKILNDED